VGELTYGKHVYIGRGGMDLQREIARLEHQTATEMLGPAIAPIGQDPDHCQWCACVAAGHRTVEAVSSFACDNVTVFCGECGADLQGLV
jgi:hypothetical protein